jgi:hypothetical protein
MIGPVMGRKERGEKLQKFGDKLGAFNAEVTDAKFRMWQWVLPPLILICLVSGAIDLYEWRLGGLDDGARGEAEGDALIRLGTGGMLLVIWLLLFRKRR